jgi:hypothetical protein
MTVDDVDPLIGLCETAADALEAVCSATMMALGDNPAEELRPVVEAILAEEAGNRWVQQQVDQTGIRAMDFRNGVEMELEPAREMVALWVGAARTMLGNATNYTETIAMDVKVAESPEKYTLVVQRHGPGILTPHEARMKAEAHAGKLADDARFLLEWLDGPEVMHSPCWDADGTTCDRCTRVAQIRERLEA